MMKEMIPPPLPPKTRGGNSCSTTAVAGAGAGATVFVRPNVQVHSTRDSVTNAYSSFTSTSSTTVNGDHLGTGIGTGGHVVKIKINPENGELKTSPTVTPIISSVQLNCHKPAAPTEETPGSPTSVVRISIGDTQTTQQQHQSISPEEMRGGADRTSAYFFCNGGISAVMSSGQCSPSDTLDSGTCSDLDGTPPPLPKKKSVTVTVIGAQHKRASSLTSSGADPDSASGSDNESNISCDSLNSNDLNNHEGIQIPTPPPLVRQTNNTSSSAFLPQGLLKDIRDRSAKLSQPTINLTEVKETISNTIEIIDHHHHHQPIPKSPEPSISRTSPVFVSESTYEERQEQKKSAVVVHATEKTNRVYMYESDKYYKFHLNEHAIDTESDTLASSKLTEEDEYFAGYKDILGGDGASTIRSAKGTVRGVKNRVRAGIATFLQINDATTKSYREKDAGKVVVYSTTMGIVRHTYQQCVKVKQILRTHLVKFEERDVFMSTECQQEIRERMRCDSILIPQVFVDGQHIGDAETIERLNETGELRKILKPYKSPDACTTCNACGGYRLLPCPVCNGSKKSVHRNDFTTEFVALKCMNCDEVGLVRCSTCS